MEGALLVTLLIPIDFFFSSFGGGGTASHPPDPHCLLFLILWWRGHTHGVLTLGDPLPYLVQGVLSLPA